MNCIKIDIKSNIIETNKYLKVSPNPSSCRSLEYLPSKPNWLSRLIGWLKGDHPSSNLDRVVSTASKIAKEAINKSVLTEMQAIMLQRNLENLKAKAQRHNSHWLVKFISIFTKRILCSSEGLKNIQDQINQLEQIKRVFIAKAKTQNSQTPAAPAVQPKAQDLRLPAETPENPIPANELEIKPAKENAADSKDNPLAYDTIGTSKTAEIKLKPFPWEQKNNEKITSIVQHVLKSNQINPTKAPPALSLEQIAELEKYEEKSPSEDLDQGMPSQKSGNCAAPSTLSQLKVASIPTQEQAATAVALGAAAVGAVALAALGTATYLGASALKGASWTQSAPNPQNNPYHFFANDSFYRNPSILTSLSNKPEQAAKAEFQKNILKILKPEQIALLMQLDQESQKFSIPLGGSSVPTSLSSEWMKKAFAQTLSAQEDIYKEVPKPVSTVDSKILIGGEKYIKVWNDTTPITPKDDPHVEEVD